MVYFHKLDFSIKCLLNGIQEMMDLYNIALWEKDFILFFLIRIIASVYCPRTFIYMVILNLNKLNKGCPNK